MCGRGELTSEYSVNWVRVRVRVKVRVRVRVRPRVRVRVGVRVRVRVLVRVRVRVRPLVRKRATGNVPTNFQLQPLKRTLIFNGLNWAPIRLSANRRLSLIRLRAA